MNSHLNNSVCTRIHCCSLGSVICALTEHERENYTVNSWPQNLEALMTLQWMLCVYTQLTLHTCSWANFTSPDVFPEVSSNQFLQPPPTSRHFSPFRSNQTDWWQLTAQNLGLINSLVMKAHWSLIKDKGNALANEMTNWVQPYLQNFE